MIHFTKWRFLPPVYEVCSSGGGRGRGGVSYPGLGYPSHPGQGYPSLPSSSHDMGTTHSISHPQPGQGYPSIPLPPQPGQRSSPKVITNAAIKILLNICKFLFFSWQVHHLTEMYYRRSDMSEQWRKHILLYLTVSTSDAFGLTHRTHRHQHTVQLSTSSKE